MRNCWLNAFLLFAVAEQYVYATWNFGNIPDQVGSKFPSLGHFLDPSKFPNVGGNTGNNRFTGRGGSAKRLKQGFYANTCANAEVIVRDTVRKHYNTDPTIAAGILRLFFHDCFVRGCDASILLDKTLSSEPNEKSALANGFTLHGEEVIDAAKSAVEAACPGIVSCADILSFATRDVAVLAGLRNFPMIAGRRDGTVSLASEVSNNLPTPFATVDNMTEMFRKKGFSQAELVILLGAHSIGGAHCFTFTHRLYNKTDPALDVNLSQQLKNSCPVQPKNADITKNAKVDFDPASPMMLDASYYTHVQTGRGLLTSDSTLMTDRKTREIVARMAANPERWKRKFSLALVRLSTLDVLVGNEGQIRQQCRAVKDEPSQWLPKFPFIPGRGF